MDRACWLAKPCCRHWRPVVLFALLTAVSLNAVADCVKTVRWADDPPYAFRAASGEVAGLDSDLAREALKGLRCEAKFVELPWARALEELKAGRLDILPGARRTPERESFAYFSRPINKSPNLLFTTPAFLKSQRLTTLSDITSSQFRLGAQIGVSYGPEFDALTTNPAFSEHLTWVSSRRNAWRMISLGRLDGIIADELTALQELQQLGLSNAVARSGVVVSTDTAHFALSRTTLTPEFVADLDRSLGTVLADGRYKSIFEKYVPCVASVAKLGCR